MSSNSIDTLFAGLLIGCFCVVLAVMAGDGIARSYNGYQTDKTDQAMVAKAERSATANCLKLGPNSRLFVLPGNDISQGGVAVGMGTTAAKRQ